ncbi:CD209 antigen-like protein A isoform X2 [Mastacembelus armatus]|uniref:CD209 antigen-like protein A isoform X2 n=1 Tax=Mastacembelus armatus TaxID=205130 RepID=UPI000E461765|nr:CD209 antigen-like protein A isoform X2 [Mastacembelus armatus]
MSADIQSVSDVRVKYIRGVPEDTRETDRSQDGQQLTDVGLQQAGRHSEKKLPAVKRSRFRVWTVALGVLYLLILAAIIIRYVSVKLENEQLKIRINNLSRNYSLLENKTANMAADNSQLQEEVKKLKDKTEGKWCPEGWTRFGCSCYFKFTEMKYWDESRTDCQDKGADLVSINSKEEQEFVRKLNMKGQSWIGLFRESTWKWLDGSALTETFWATGHGKPTGGSYGSCCDQQGKWTQSYNYKKTWICEK